MKSFVKGLWSRTSKDDSARSLNHPSNLQEGDMVLFSDSFGLPEEIRDKTLKVVNICTYQFEHDVGYSFNLEGEADDRVSMSIDKEDGRETLSISMQITRSDVEAIFDLDEFAGIFEEDGSATIHTLAASAGNLWLAESYYQEAQGERGYFYEHDYRGSAPPVHEGEGEPLDYFSVVSADKSRAVEIEVYGTGETDVMLTLYRPVDDIKELWPAASVKS